MVNKRVRLNDPMTTFREVDVCCSTMSMNVFQSSLYLPVQCENVGQKNRCIQLCKLGAVQMLYCTNTHCGVYLTKLNAVYKRQLKQRISLVICIFLHLKSKIRVSLFLLCMNVPNWYVNKGPIKGVLTNFSAFFRSILGSKRL